MSRVMGLAFVGNGHAELREFEIRHPVGTEVRIAVMASGICGSDIEPLRSADGLRNHTSGDFEVAGHEPAGRIESVGPDVWDFEVGDRVLVYHVLGCGNCYPCRLGYPVLCTSDRRVAYGGGRDGGHAPLMLAEQRSLIKLPDALSFVDGAMVACGVATAYSAILKSGLRAGDSLLVTGLGPVGLAVALLASDMGIVVLGSDVNAERARNSRLHGVSHLVEGPDIVSATEQVRRLTTGQGVRAAIDCSGAASARKLAIHATATLGTVVFVGIGRQELAFEATSQVIMKMLTIRGSWISSSAEMQDVTEHLAARDLHPHSLVSHTYRLEDAVDAYDAFAAGASGKMVVTFDDHPQNAVES